MSMNERRKLRREARRATLQSVAAAPSQRASSKSKTRSRKFPLRRAMILSSMLALIIGAMMATPKSALAVPPPPPVPEIDPGSMAGALTLLAGGFLALTDRTRRS